MFTIFLNVQHEDHVQQKLIKDVILNEAVVFFKLEQSVFNSQTNSSLTNTVVFLCFYSIFWWSGCTFLAANFDVISEYLNEIRQYGPRPHQLSLGHFDTIWKENIAFQCDITQILLLFMMKPNQRLLRFMWWKNGDNTPLRSGFEWRGSLWCSLEYGLCKRRT